MSGFHFAQQYISYWVKLLPGQFPRPSGPVCQSRIPRRMHIPGIDDCAGNLLEIPLRWRDSIPLPDKDKLHLEAEIEKRLYLRADHQAGAMGIWLR